MLKAEPGIKIILLTDYTGKIISQISKININLDKDYNEMGACASAIFYATEEQGRRIKLSKLNIIVSEYDDAKIFYCHSKNSVISIFTDNDVCIGLIRLILKRYGEELDRIIKKLL